MNNLASLEAIIERGKLVYTEVGEALREIQEGKLYRDHGYATFEHYCKTRWGFSRSVGYDYINASRTASNVESVGISLQNPNYSQAVVLSKLEPEQQRQIARETDFASTTVMHLQRVIEDERELKDELDRAEAPSVVAPPMSVKMSKVRTIRSPFEELQDSGKLQRFELSTATLDSGVTCSLGRYELHLYGINETQTKRIAEALQ